MILPHHSSRPWACVLLLPASSSSLSTRHGRPQHCSSSSLLLTTTTLPCLIVMVLQVTVLSDPSGLLEWIAPEELPVQYGGKNT